MSFKLDKGTIEVILGMAQAPIAENDFSGLEDDSGFGELVPFARRLHDYIKINPSLFSGGDYRTYVTHAVNFFRGQTGDNAPVNVEALVNEAYTIAKEKREADPRWRWAIAKREWLQSNNTTDGLFDERIWGDRQALMTINDSMIEGLKKYHLGMAFAILGQRALSKLDPDMEIPNRTKEIHVLAQMVRNLLSDASAILAQARLDDSNRRKQRNRPHSGTLRGALKTMALLSRLKGELSDDRYSYYFDLIADEFETGSPGYLGRSFDLIDKAIREVEENRE